MAMQSSNSNGLPIVDLAGLRNAGTEGLAHVAEDIRVACLSTGFFYVINHEVPICLLRRVLASAVQLFDLPLCEKEAMSINKSNHMRGYFGFGADKSDGMNGDAKEGFDLGLDLPLNDTLVQANLPFHGPNVWPQSLPKFNQGLTAYYDHMLKLGLDLLRALGVGLDVTESYFHKYFTKPIAQLRLLRYPACNGKDVGNIGAGEHTDFGCLTVILQDHTGGLEIAGADGGWVAVPAVPGALVVNIGDLMQRWTNNIYPATMHRVINRARIARYSAAFFMDPDYHTAIECLSSCVSVARPACYEPIVFGDYINKRYLQTTTFSDPELV